MKNAIVIGMLALLLPVTALAAGSTLCVDPADAACFDTIQEAVDSAGGPATITVRARADGTPYRESVVVNQSDLVIEGETAPTFNITDFEDLLALDWTTERANCPVVGIDVCETTALGENCGFAPHPTATDDERTAFVVNAANVTIRHFTIRHALAGVRFNAGSDGGTAELNCFIHDRNAVFAGDDEGPTVDNLNVLRNRLFGVNARGTGGYAIEINGDDSAVELNLLHLSEGIRIRGKDHIVPRNAVHMTSGNSGIDANGGTGYFIFENWVFGTEDDGIDLFEVNGSTVADNLVTDIPDDDEGIGLSSSSTNVIVGNTIRGASNPGLNLTSGSNGNVIDDNTIESNGSDSSDDCITVRNSINNNVVNNNIRLCSNSGIALYENADFTNIATNDAQWNSIMGVKVFGSTNTTINMNVFSNNKGEGINHGESSTDAVITSNTAQGNRTDICNSGSVTTFTGNTFDTGGVSTLCVVRLED